MKALKITAIAIALLTAASACSDDDNDEVLKEYATWREANDQWLEEQALRTNDDGSAFYSRIEAPYDRNSYVLLHWWNDRSLTANNLQPLYNSTVDVKYYGQLYNDVPFDSSYVSISPTDSVSRFSVNGLIPGWTLALQKIHAGDSVEVIIPWQQAYGNSSTGKIPPYSALRFQIKLVDVAGEYIRP